jgi:hypothetical protein
VLAGRDKAKVETRPARGPKRDRRELDRFGARARDRENPVPHRRAAPRRRTGFPIAAQHGARKFFGQSQGVMCGFIFDLGAKLSLIRALDGTGAYSPW